MDDYRTIKNLNGKDVISARSGQKIASVSDTMIDPDSLRVAGLIISTGSFLRPESQIIDSDSVEVWGRDVILVTGDQVLRDEQEFDQRDAWHKTSDYLRSRTIVGTDGRKLGQVDDVLLDDRGHFVGYRLGSGAASPFTESRYVPAEVTQSMGRDVIIVDASGYTPTTEPSEVAGPAIVEEPVDWDRERENLD